MKRYENDLLATLDEFDESDEVEGASGCVNEAKACERSAWVLGLAIHPSRVSSETGLPCLAPLGSNSKEQAFPDATHVLRNGGKTRPAENKADTHSECLRSHCFCTKQEISKSFKPELPRPSKIERPSPWSVVQGMLVSQKVKDAKGNTKRPWNVRLVQVLKILHILR